jgi:hypothetical protein
MTNPTAMPPEPKPAAVEVTGNIRINVDGTDFSLMRIRQIVDAGTQLLFSQKRHRPSRPGTPQLCVPAYLTHFR